MLCIRCMPSSTRSVLCKRIVHPLSYHRSIKNFAVSSCMSNRRTFTYMGLEKHCEAAFTQCNSTVSPVLACGCAKRFFTTTSPVSNSGGTIEGTDRAARTAIPHLPFAFATYPSQGRRFTNGCCLTRCAVGIARVSYCTSFRTIHVRGKATEAEQGSSRYEGGEREQEETEDVRKNGGKKTGGRQQTRARTFRDHIRGLKEDYMKFPDIYNSANAINFVIFTVFCLYSTGSNTEEKWWMDQWGLDNTFHPPAWLLHSFLCQNFFSMAYAMMLLHTMCHAMLPTVGSRGLLIYVSATAAISGLIVWLGNRLYYGPHKPAPEKQFGPWDVVSALFIMEYLHYGVTPITILNSFRSWVRYAVWVGEIFILYYDWQTTVVGTAVGLALCKGVPRFRVPKVTGV